jgi:alkylation response protein AidB-like acyl-CoA dehydrogenase
VTNEIFEADAAECLRGDTAAWLQANWDDRLSLRDWWARLASAGLAFPTWPDGFGGRGSSGREAREVRSELTRAGAEGPPGGVGQSLAAPIILEHGTDEQKRRWVPPLADGRESWCQFFSEPGAGSDLASLRTRAVLDGDVWVINGQKVWTREAEAADRGLLLVRTRTDVPKHHGITYCVIDVDQPGIEIRPIRQMNGNARFNEVFFTDALVPTANVIGAPNDGWNIARATLAYERQNVGGRNTVTPTRVGSPGEKSGDLDRRLRDLIDAAKEVERVQATARWTRQPQALLELAQRTGRWSDPVLRDRIAAMYSLWRADQLTGMRAQAAMRRGQPPGPETSISKLVSSELGRRARDIALSILGAEGMLVGDDLAFGGAFQQMALSVQSLSIAGGTDEIQRNVVAERVLGLPREPTLDDDLPFDHQRRGAGQGET